MAQVDLVRCKEQIRHLYKDQPNLQNYLSKLTRQAWGENKGDCLEAFGSVSQIQNFLLNPGDIEFSMPEQIEDVVKDTDQEHQVASDQTTTTTEVPPIEGLPAQALEYAKMAGWGLIAIIALIALWKFTVYLLEFFYDILNAKRMVFMKVMVPRGDSKADRDLQKELAKDMKEKIARMSQVFRSLHKLGHLSVTDNILRKIFRKPKVTFIMQYERGLLYFLVGTYPEYKDIVEGAISAQFADASIEQIAHPDIFVKQHSDIIPLQAVKKGYYPIRTFKQLEDDPMNNVIDSIAKISPEDTMSVIITIKPEGDRFNRKAQKYAAALYKKDDKVLNRGKWWKKLLPWNFFSFLIRGPSEQLIQKYATGGKQGDPIIRMIKAEEEALNVMGEEAGKQAYEGGILLVTTSDDEERIQANLQTVISAFTVYKDEYNNELDQPEWLAGLLGFIVKPVWKFAALFHLPNFFFKDNIFTVNELTSLFHFPDGTYNRAPIIKWMDYKVLAAPDNLPLLQEETEFSITGILAEDYKGGDLSDILEETRHPAVTTKKEIKTKKYDITGKNVVPKEGEQIVEEDGKTFLIRTKEKLLHSLKVYKDGILLGLNVHRNKFSPVYMKKKDRTRHHYIVGKSGTGKSVYISMLARQDIWAGHGVCVIDPHGDLVDDILKYIPKHRAKDVIYFDAGNEERPMGLNLYEINHMAQADRAVNDAVEIFVKMFGPEIFGPRIQEYFKYGSLTLLEDLEEGATLIDVPRLFTDEVFREYKVRKVSNPVVRNFWERTYEAMGDREKQEIIPYFTSKFVSFITNSLIRNIIGQTKSAFNFREVMDNNKILLINLSKGAIGELNAQLLGMIIVSKIYNAAMSRTDQEAEDRKDFYLYVDEFQNFITDTFADILSEARKYKLCLIMAHQYIAQLDSNAGNNIGEGKSQVKDAVFGNVGTMQSFKVGAPDAEFLEKEYAPVLVAQDILSVANYKAYIKLNINNTTSRPFSLNAIYTQDYKSKKVAEVLKQYCEKKYGRKKEFVDAEISARIGIFSQEDEDKMEVNQELGDVKLATGEEIPEQKSTNPPTENPQPRVQNPEPVGAEQEEEEEF